MKRFRPQRFSLFILTCVVLHLLVSNSFADKERFLDILEMARPAVKTFTDENGLPSNSVMTLEKDQQGRLWIGTQDGAAYYDGHKWNIVNMPNRNVSNYVFDILAAEDGSIWFATDGGGVHRLSNGEWNTFDNSTGLPNSFTRSLLESHDKAGNSIYWVGTRDGLFKYNGIEWTRIDLGSASSRSRVRSLLMTKDDDGKETVWVGTYNGLVRIVDDVITVFDISDGLPHNTVFALREVKYIDEKLLLIGTDGGLVAFKDGQISVPLGIPDMLSSGIRSINESDSGSGKNILWVATDGKGVAAYMDGSWTKFSSERKIAVDVAFDILDAGIGDGSVWVAVVGGGLSRIELGNWARLDESSGMTNKIAFSIRSIGNDYWFATFGSGISEYQNGKWSSVRTGKGINSDYVYSLFKEHNNNLWAGTENGISFLDKGRWHPPPSDNKLLNTETWGFTSSENITGEQTLWIATSIGAVEVKDGNYQLHNSSNGLPDDRIREILVTEKGSEDQTIWAATYGGGVAKFDGSKWITINIDNGLPSNRILALAEYIINGEKKVLAATGGGIAAIPTSDNLEPILTFSSETEPEMLNNYVLDLIIDDKGRLYALTNKGVTRFTPSKLPERLFDVYTFTTEDGLPSNECVSGSGHIDEKGRIFVGTVNGVGILDTKREVVNESPKLLFLSDAVVGGKSRAADELTQLSHNENNPSFQYALLSKFREAATRYRTQLVGLEAEPTAWTAEANRDFTFLPPGEYVFKVWARDHSGAVVESPGVAMVIFPAWWQTWWAMALYLVAVVLVVSITSYLIYRNRLNRLLEIERVRTRIAADLHDDIGASLSKIAILSEVMTQKITRENNTEVKPLAAISETSRDLMNSMSDIVWAINPKRDHLIDLIRRMRRFATEVLSGRDIDFDYNAPDSADGIRLDLETRRQIHLIFKEAVNNCVRHSGCSKVEIDIMVDPQTITLRIADNGNGIPETEIVEGNGLASMKARSAAIGGTLQINSSESGTEVTLAVPNRSNSGFFRRLLPV